MHERNPYRTALLWIAILVGGIGLVAWFIGMYQSGLLYSDPGDDNPGAGVGAIAVGNLGIAGGSLAALLWLVLSGVTWALDPQKAKIIANEDAEDAEASS